MAFTSAAVSVGTAATPLGTSKGNIQQPGTILVANNSAQVVFVGGAGVTTVNGVPIPANGSLSVTVGPGETLYGIVASTTADCRVLTSLS